MQCSVMKPKAVNQPVDERSRERIESVRHQVYLFSFSTFAGALKILITQNLGVAQKFVVYIIYYIIIMSLQHDQHFHRWIKVNAISSLLAKID